MLEDNGIHINGVFLESQRKKQFVKSDLEKKNYISNFSRKVSQFYVSGNFTSRQYKARSRLTSDERAERADLRSADAGANGA